MADAKPNKDIKRVFDVSKPGQSTPSANSRPTIVGHKPLIGDPMLKEKVLISQLSPTDTHDFIPEKGYRKPDGPQAVEEIPEGEQLQPTRGSNILKPSAEIVAQADKDKQVASSAKMKSEKEDTIQESENSGNGAIVNAVLGDAKGVKEAELAALERKEAVTKLTESGKYHVALGDVPRHHKHLGFKAIILTFLVAMIVLFVLGYLLIDSGVVKTNIKLPYHIFKKTDVAEVTTSPAQSTVTQSTTNTTTPVTTTPKLPVGFVEYKISDAGYSFGYPSSWGDPTESVEKGFTKRSTTLKPDSSYAYKLSFTKNKDVELVITSAAILPPARATQYYDYLQWCTNSKDSKLYQQLLSYKTVAGIDSPDIVTCDQGPLTATKINDSTIVQIKLKDAMSGTTIGDVYTLNLTSKQLPVVHLKDAISSNADDIKQLLTTFKSITP